MFDLGWGVINEDKDRPDVLLEVEVPVVKQKECTQQVNDGMICAGGENGMDSCKVKKQKKRVTCNFLFLRKSSVKILDVNHSKP